MKRMRIKRVCPNPLFISWLENWKEDAMAKGSEMQYCFGRALNTLKKFPLPLDSGRACIVLENFGPKLCAMLDRKLEEYKSSNPDNLNQSTENNDPSALLNIKSNDRTNPFDNSAGMSNNNKNNTGKNKQLATDAGKRQKNSGTSEQRSKRLKSPAKQPQAYFPSWRSGGYAILITLYEETQNPNSLGFMTKADLQTEAQKYCDASLKKPEPGSRYCAWASMTTLIQKGLIIKSSNPAKYRLTDAGLAMALKLSEVNQNDAIFDSSRSHISPSSTETSASLKEKRSFGFAGDHSAGPSNQNQNKDFEYFPRENIQKDFIADDNEPEILCIYDSDNEKDDISKQKKIPDRLQKLDDCIQTINNNKRTDSQSSTSSGNEIDVIFRPQTYDVILIVDDRETAGGKTRPKNDPTISELTTMGIQFEVRNLKIGDFTWIARCRNSAEELVLPYIVERKRMDDFAGSIKDGRYREQKFRLKKSGIQNVTYLIEHHGNNQFTGLPMTTLSQAAINTLVQDGFAIKYTNNHRESMAYLVSISNMLTKLYQDKTLIGCKKEDLIPVKFNDDIVRVMLFKSFNKAAAKIKIFTAKEMFIRHLVQLNGLSFEKALAIVDFYPTPKSLKQAFDDAGSSGGETLLAGIQFGATNRQIGPAISKTLYQFYTKKDF